MKQRSLVITVIILAIVGIVLAVAIVVKAWEDNNGAISHQQANRGVQMQLTEPPAPPTTIPVIPAWSNANDGRFCYGAIPLLQYYSPGWDVNQFARIMWRESNCVPTVRNSCCHGLLQINWAAHRSWLDDIGITSVGQLYDSATNIRAAAALYRRAGGTDPWEQTR